MTTEAPSLSDDDAADLLESVASDLREGESSRAQARRTLFALLRFEDGVETSDGPLLDEGRLSFGRAREGEDGIGYWLPSAALPDSENA